MSGAVEAQTGLGQQQHPIAPSPSQSAAVVYTKATVQDFLERYEVGETVGVGGFAVVKRGRDKLTGEPVAIKVVDKSRYAAGDNSLEREIQVLCKVDHPNCIKLYAVYITGRKVYIVTELVTGGELLDRVTEKGNYTELDAAHIIRQILQGVQYLHSHGIVHRDLKLENMVMLNAADDSPVKIADFGLSKFFSNDNVLSTMCGSPQYVAPEVLGVGDGLKEYSPAVDMWSVGVILFILLSGYSPFDDDNDAVLFEKIKSGNYDADDPIWENISAQAKDVVAKLLTVDAEARLSAEEALSHPWVQGETFEKKARRGNKQLQSTMDKMKSMAVKRESMRQQSFKAAAGSGADGLGGGGGGAMPAAAAAGGAVAAAAASKAGAAAAASAAAPGALGGPSTVAEGEHEGEDDASNAQQQLLLRQQQQQQQQQLEVQMQRELHNELLRQMQQEQQLLLLQQQHMLLRQQQQQLAAAQGLPMQQIPAAAMMAALQPSLVQGLAPPGTHPSTAAAAAGAGAPPPGLGSAPRAMTPQQQLQQQQQQLQQQQQQLQQQQQQLQQQQQQQQQLQQLQQLQQQQQQQQQLQQQQQQASQAAAAAPASKATAAADMAAGSQQQLGRSQ